MPLSGPDGLAESVTVHTAAGVASFAAGSLVIPEDVAPGLYELLIEDCTAHTDPGHKLTTCRMPTEAATQMMHVRVVAKEEEPAAEEES